MYNSYGQARWWFRHGLGLFHPSGSWKTVCIMDGFYYRDILEQDLQPSINHFKLDQRCTFMHGNAPEHASGLIKDWLKRKKIETLPWPPYSPDLNPKENL